MESELSIYPRIVVSDDVIFDLKRIEEELGYGQYMPLKQDHDHLHYFDMIKTLSQSPDGKECMAHLREKLIPLRRDAPDPPSIQKVNWFINYFNDTIREMNLGIDPID